MVERLIEQINIHTDRLVQYNDEHHARELLVFAEQLAKQLRRAPSLCSRYMQKLEEKLRELRNLCSWYDSAVSPIRGMDILTRIAEKVCKAVEVLEEASRGYTM